MNFKKKYIQTFCGGLKDSHLGLVTSYVYAVELGVKKIGAKTGLAK